MFQYLPPPVLVSAQLILYVPLWPPDLVEPRYYVVRTEVYPRGATHVTAAGHSTTRPRTFHHDRCCTMPAAAPPLRETATANANRHNCRVRPLWGPHIYTPTRRIWAKVNKPGLAYGPAWSVANGPIKQRDTSTTWLCAVLQIRPVCDHPGYSIRQPRFLFLQAPTGVCVCRTYDVSTEVAQGHPTAAHVGTPWIFTPLAFGYRKIRRRPAYSHSRCMGGLLDYTAKRTRRTTPAVACFAAYLNG